LSNKRHLIIDCDPGVDDALALLYVIDSGVYRGMDILTIAGNVGVNQTTANAVRLVALACHAKKVDRLDKIRLFRGCSTALDGMRPTAASVHGRDGMGDVPLRFLDEELSLEMARQCAIDTQKAILQKQNAANYLASLLAEADEDTEYDLVCTGPLTNVATALNMLGQDSQSKFWSCFHRVVIMGGAINVPGNVTPFAEFNFYADPMAAKIVLDSWRSFQEEARQNTAQPNFEKKLLLVPLDVTQEVVLMWEELEAPNKLSEIYKKKAAFPPKKSGECLIHRFVACMLQKYFLFHSIMANPVRYHKRNNKLMADGRFYQRIPKQEISSYREDVAHHFMEKRLSGSSGLKSLPRFCYLHDPLAIHVAICKLNKKQDLFSEACIAVSTDSGETRGMCMPVTLRPAPIEALNMNARSTHAEGTTVHYLNPDKFTCKKGALISDHEKMFKLKLLQSLGISAERS